MSASPHGEGSLYTAPCRHIRYFYAPPVPTSSPSLARRALPPAAFTPSPSLLRWLLPLLLEPAGETLQHTSKSSSTALTQWHTEAAAWEHTRGTGSTPARTYSCLRAHAARLFHASPVSYEPRQQLFTVPACSSATAYSPYTYELT